jgi:hypothetical protein
MNSILTFSRVPFLQVGKGSGECNRDEVIHGSVRVVCELEWVLGVRDDAVVRFMAVDVSATWQ